MADDLSGEERREVERLADAALATARSFIRRANDAGYRVGINLGTSVGFIPLTADRAPGAPIPITEFEEEALLMYGAYYLRKLRLGPEQVLGGMACDGDNKGPDANLRFALLSPTVEERARVAVRRLRTLGGPLLSETRANAIADVIETLLQLQRPG